MSDHDAVANAIEEFNQLEVIRKAEAQILTQQRQNAERTLIDIEKKWNVQTRFLIQNVITTVCSEFRIKGNLLYMNEIKPNYGDNSIIYGIYKSGMHQKLLVRLAFTLLGSSDIKAVISAQQKIQETIHIQNVSPEWVKGLAEKAMLVALETN
jgi:hypothetical protein